MSSPALTREQPSTSPAEPAVDAVHVRQRAWQLTIWAAMGFWSVALFVVARDSLLAFGEGRFDLGNMVQAVWATANGMPLEVTDASGEQMTRLGAHADPLLALLAPLWLVWPSPQSLILAQVVVVALGALPVWWLGRKHLGSDHAAGLLALGYLAYPWVATSAAAPIHPVSFAIPFLLFCVWWLDTDRLALFAVFALLTMATGELMGLPILGLGIWYALARGKRRAGAVVAAAGFAWTAAAIFVIVPYFAGAESRYYTFYDDVGGGPVGVVKMLVTDPTVVLGALVEVHDVAYVIWLGLPLLFLFLLSPGLAAVALPQLLANTLSDFRSMSDPRYHSVAAVIPFLIAATVFGLTRLGPGRRPITAAAILLCSSLLALAVGPWLRVVGETPLGGGAGIPSGRVSALREAVALVPDDARVSASNSVGAHLSARRYIYSVPVLGTAEWVVIDRGDPWSVTAGSPILTRRPDLVAGLVGRLRADPGWSAVYERAGVVVFRRAL